jgi:acetyl esterase/lipase
MRSYSVCLAVVLVLAACSPATPRAASADTGKARTGEAQTATPASGLMTFADLAKSPKPQPTKTISFGPAAYQSADLWLPEGAGPFPVVLMVHGGCWQKKVADRTLMNYAAEGLRKEGFAVWNIEYRGVDEPGGGYPGTFLDAGAAADKLVEVGKAYNLKTDRVVAFGHSAGGQLALWLAARPRLPAANPLRGKDPLPIMGVLNAGGLPDLKASASVAPRECLASILNKLTGAPGPDRKDVFADTSPAEMLPMGIRQISVSGADDPISPPSLGRAYADRARAAKDEAGFIVVPHTGHVELIAPGTDAFNREVSVLRELTR